MTTVQSVKPVAVVWPVVREGPTAREELEHLQPLLCQAKLLGAKVHANSLSPTALIQAQRICRDNL